MKKYEKAENVPLHYPPLAALVVGVLHQTEKAGIVPNKILPFREEHIVLATL